MELVRLLTEVPASLPGERSPGCWLAGEGSKTLAIHMWLVASYLLVTWYPPVLSSATVLFLDSKSLPSTGVGSVCVCEGGMVKGFETLLPKQPFNLSVCLAQSSLVSRKCLGLPIPDLFESFQL